MRELKTTLTVCDSGGPDPVLLDQTEPGSSCISTFCSQWDSMLNELLPRCNLLHGLPGDACSSSVSSTSRFSWFDFSHFSKYKLPEMWSCFCDTSFKTRFIWFLRIKWKTPETNPDVDLIPLSDWDKNKLLNVLNFLFIVSSVAGEQMKPAVLTKQTTFMIGTIKLYSKYKMCWSDAVEQTEEKKNMFSEIQSCCRDVLVGRGQFWFCSGSVLDQYRCVWQLTLGAFGHEHCVVVAFSVSSDFNSKELNSGGWKQETNKLFSCFFSFSDYCYY